MPARDPVGQLSGLAPGLPPTQPNVIETEQARRPPGRPAALGGLLDQVEQAGSNDLLIPLRDGLISEQHIHAELGELVAGTRPGRTDPGQITLYKSVGVAVQDAAAVGLVLDAARQQGVGREVDL
jgi:ornithine cyclodeaminase/alanine dehydrogenase-like protein (mu-crystallin family)